MRIDNNERLLFQATIQQMRSMLTNAYLLLRDRGYAENEPETAHIARFMLETFDDDVETMYQGFRVAKLADTE